MCGHCRLHKHRKSLFQKISLEKKRELINKSSDYMYDYKLSLIPKTCFIKIFDTLMWIFQIELSVGFEHIPHCVKVSSQNGTILCHHCLQATIQKHLCV